MLNNPKRIQRLPLQVPLPPEGERGGASVSLGPPQSQPHFPSLPFSPSPSKGGGGFFSPPPSTVAPPAPSRTRELEIQSRLEAVEMKLREAREVQERGVRAWEERALFLSKVRQRYFAWSVRRMKASVSARVGPRFNGRGITLGGLRAYQGAYGGVGGPLDALTLGELSRGASHWVEQTPHQFAQGNPKFCGPGRVYVSLAAGVEGTTLGGLIVALGQWEAALTHPPPTPFTYILEAFNTPHGAPSAAMGEEDGAWWSQVHCQGVRKVGRVVVVLGGGGGLRSSTEGSSTRGGGGEWEWEWRALLECGWKGEGVTVDFALPTPLPEFFQATLSRGGGAWGRALGSLTPRVPVGVSQLRGVFVDEPAVNPRVVVQCVERSVRVWVAERGREWLMMQGKQREQGVVGGGRVSGASWAHVGALFAGLGRVGVAITLYKTALEEVKRGGGGGGGGETPPQLASWKAVIGRLEAKRVGSATNLMEVLRRNIVVWRGVGGERKGGRKA